MRQVFKGVFRVQRQTLVHNFRTKEFFFHKETVVFKAFLDCNYYIRPQAELFLRNFKNLNNEEPL